MAFKRPDLIATLIILTVAVPLFLVAIDWGLPNHYSYAPDAISPLRSLEAVDSYFEFNSGWADKYPPGHYYLTGLIYKPYMSWLRSNAEHEPFFGAVDEVVHGAYGSDIKANHLRYVELFPGFRHELTTMMIVGRLLTVAMGLGAVLLLYLITRTLTESRFAGVLAAVLSASYYPTIFHAHTLNVDIPYVFWLMASLYFLVRLLDNGKLRHFVLAGVTAALAVSTKDQAYGVLVGMVAVFLIFWRRPQSLNLAASLVDEEGKVQKRPFPLGRVLSSVFAAGAVYVVMNNLIFNLSGFESHLEHILGDGSKNFRERDPNAGGQVQLLGDVFEKWLETTPPGGLGAVLLLLGCAIGIVRRPGPTLFAMIPAISYYWTFIAVIGYCYARFLIPAMFLLTIPAARLLSDVARTMKGGRKLGRILVGGAVSCLVAFGASSIWLLIDDPRERAHDWLEEHLGEDDYVLVYSDMTFTSTKLPDESRFEFVDLREPSDVRAERMKTLKPTYLVLTSFFGNRANQPDIGTENTVLGFRSRVEAAFAPAFDHPILENIHANPFVVIRSLSR